MLAWDRVGGNVLVGASVGPSLLIHSSQATVRTETDVMLAPMVAVRVGYSKPFSRLGRRFYVVAEPKARWLSGGRNLNPQLDWGAVLLVGSGRGR
jgi:hypothetical protein